MKETLEQEANRYIEAHKRSVLYGTLDEFEEMYNLSALKKFKTTNIKSNVDRVIAYLEKDEKKYKEVYNKAWELIEPYLSDDMTYAISEEPSFLNKILSTIFEVEE